VILYFLRHGDAGPYRGAADDAARELSAAGVAALEAAAPMWGGLNLRPDVVLASPLARARHTAELFVAGMGLTDQPVVDGRNRHAVHHDRHALLGDALAVESARKAVGVKSIVVEGELRREAAPPEAVIHPTPAFLYGERAHAVFHHRFEQRQHRVRLQHHRIFARFHMARMPRRLRALQRPAFQGLEINLRQPPAGGVRVRRSMALRLFHHKGQIGLRAGGVGEQSTRIHHRIFKLRSAQCAGGQQLVPARLAANVADGARPRVGRHRGDGFVVGGDRQRGLRLGKARPVRALRQVTREVARLPHRALDAKR